jgi:hypothetical protein
MAAIMNAAAGVLAVLKGIFGLRETRRSIPSQSIHAEGGSAAAADGGIATVVNVSSAQRPIWTSSNPPTDQEIVDLLTRRLFDRPAFLTPFRREGCIDDFRTALADTIRALNTGAYRHTDGSPIGMIPTRHDIRDPELARAMTSITHKVYQLSEAFDGLVQSGDIRRCGCGNAHCNQTNMTDLAIVEMDSRRAEILRDLTAISPTFPLPRWIPPL